ncbi:translation initiation factor eIF-2B alpha subunit [Astrocystis sublimbata]|nr:translation initiation factor eIF-2B alpha subunit [Astrocystis sublimbata]
MVEIVPRPESLHPDVFSSPTESLYRSSPPNHVCAILFNKPHTNVHKDTRPRTMDSNGATADKSGQLPIRSNPDVDAFDIVATYLRLLAEDPELTMPMAAIEALIEALGASSATTVFETMRLVEDQSDRLKHSPLVANPMAACHGSEFFKQYLLRELRQLPSSGGSASGSGNRSEDQQFEAVRQHLLRNARLFATRAKDAREKIASEGRLLIPSKGIILTHGGSRVVGTLLGRAVERVDGTLPKSFKVIYAVSENRLTESNKVIAALRAKNIAVATIPQEGVAQIMSKVNVVFAGAEVITAQGGVISRLGTYQLARLAKDFGKPFYVAAEQHKLGKTYPVDQFSYGCGNYQQYPLDFQRSRPARNVHEPPETDDERRAKEVRSASPLDYTPPDLITSFICDHGVKSTVAMEHQVIDMFVG